MEGYSREISQSHECPIHVFSLLLFVGFSSLPCCDLHQADKNKEWLTHLLQPDKNYSTLVLVILRFDLHVSPGFTFSDAQILRALLSALISS